MKCIHCQTDNTLKDRTANQGRCKNCQHPFVFEPTAMGNIKLTDPMFAKAIADLSANNTLFYTPKQLLYFLDKRLKTKGISTTIGYIIFYLFPTVVLTMFMGGAFFSATRNVLALFAPTTIASIFFIFNLASVSRSAKSSSKARQSSARALQIIGGIILIGGTIGSLSVNSFFIFAISVLLGVSAIYLGTQQRRNPQSVHQEFTIEPAQLQAWLDRWREINGSASNLLPPAREDRTTATVNPDVTAYSFDRLVVCSSSTIAQLLIANNFHFENNCAILSITGYPQSIFDTTMTMLRRNPELKVYALHDCSPRGIGLVHQLQTSPQWFQNSPIEIFDVGLLPRQILANKALFIQNSVEAIAAAKQIPLTLRQRFSPEELSWLEAGNFVELESFTPKQLIHILNRGTANSRAENDDGGLILIGNDYGSSYYVVDSFG